MSDHLEKYVTVSELREWAQTQIENGVPRQKLCADIMARFDHASAKPSEAQKIHNRACLTVEDEIIRTMMDHNEEARQLEQAGKIDQAIALFEESVRDLFLSPFPYERLRIIYTAQERYQDAIRVCQAYIDNPYLTGGAATDAKAAFRQKIQEIEEDMT